MTPESNSMFESLKQDVALSSAKENVPFQVETDVSDYAVMVTLS